MNCYSLTIGSRNTPGAAAKFSATDEATIQKITAKHFPLGSTILEASGNWLDPATGMFVREESRQILVCATTREDLKGWYNELCYAMQQKQLMLVELGPVDFINADPVKLRALQTKVKASTITGTSRQAPKTSI